MQALLSRLRIEKHSSDDSDLRHLVETVRPVANPKAIYDVCYVQARAVDSVTIADVTFTSRVLRVNLDNVERVFPFVATCGREFDDVHVPGDDLLKQFWLDELKAVALEAGRKYLNGHLKAGYALGKVTSMSPGAGDRDVWPIEQQQLLFSLFGNTQDLIGVRLTDSCLMIPNKSVSGIIFPTEVTFETCRLCHRQGCPGRAAPYDKALFDKIHG